MTVMSRAALYVLVFLLTVTVPVCGSAPDGREREAAGTASAQEFRYQDTIRLRYWERQEGHPYTLLFLHGFGAGSHYWREVAEYFASTVNTIALDLKGFGYSDKPRDGKYRLRDQAEIVKAFIESKNLTNVILVGHSMGGAVALLTHFELPPGTVKGLILLGTAAYGQQLPNFFHFLRTPVLNQVVPALLPTRLVVKQVLRRVLSDQSKVTEAMIQQYVSYLKTPNAYYAARETAKQIVPDNVDEIIDRTIHLEIPVLIIWGEEDKILALSSGQRLHYDIKGSEFVIIPEAGHNVHEDKPAETIQAMEGFLRRRITGGPS